MASTKNTKTEDLAVVETTPTALAVGDFDYGDDANQGFEHTGKDDLQIPFIKLLQSLSPQVQENSPEGARAGMFYNTVTRKLYTKPVVIPVHKERSFIEWVPRDQGGGFVQKYSENDLIVRQAIKDNRNSVIKLKLGPDDLVETINYIVLVLDETGSEYETFGILDFTSTKLKQAKEWYTAMITTKDSNKRPLFAYRAVLSSFSQKSKKGTSFNVRAEPFNGLWYSSPDKEGFKKPDSLVDPSNRALYLKAKELREMFTSGALAVDYSKQKNDDGSESGGDEEAPF